MAALLSIVALSSDVAPARAQTPQNDGIAILLRGLERAVQSGGAAAYISLLTDSADRAQAADFTSTEFLPGSTRVVIQERDREALPGTLRDEGYRLMVDAFPNIGRARAATWFIDVKRVGRSGSDREWAISGEERVSAVESLYRLAVNTTKQFAARDLKLSAEDLELTLTDGSLFVVDVDQGTTGLVLLGNGTLKFRPTPETEQGQVKIFSGSETLEGRFDALRGSPGDFQALVAPRACRRAVDPRSAARPGHFRTTRRNRSSSLAISAATHGRCCRSRRLSPETRGGSTRFLRAVGAETETFALRSQAASATSRSTHCHSGWRHAAARTTRTTWWTTTSSTTTSMSRCCPIAVGSRGAHAFASRCVRTRSAASRSSLPIRSPCSRS
jgi:hypothetical protein